MIAKLTIIYTHSSMFRGFVRFGMYLPTVLKIYKRILTYQEHPVRMMYIQTLADISGIVCLLLDHPAYLQKVKLINWPESKVATYGWWCCFIWGAMVILDMICNLVYIRDDLERITQLKQRRGQVKLIADTIMKYEDNYPGSGNPTQQSIKGKSFEMIKPQNGGQSNPSKTHK